MDMNEVSSSVVEMYPILRRNSVGDITTTHFLHIAWPGEVPLFTIYKYSKIGMPMYHIWSGYCNVYYSCRDTHQNYTEEDCFEHNKRKLFYSLYHYLETTESKPYHRDKSWFKYTKKEEYNHRYSSEG
jgi:hypothetical protein